MSELLLGCGNARAKKVTFEAISPEWTDLTTLDIDEGVYPDVTWDLGCPHPMPFGDNSFDEIHAYEVLEHFGKQGDWKAFFRTFSDLWRLLKPDGYLVGTVPMWDSPWAWGDPGHTRLIPKESFIFLDQDEYKQIGKTAMTDYRPWFKGNFKTVATSETDHQMAFVLQAVK